MQNFHDFETIPFNKSNDHNGIISDNNNFETSSGAKVMKININSNPNDSMKRVYSICDLSCSSESYEEYAAMFDVDEEEIADEEASWSISSHSAECWLRENDHSISAAEFQNVFSESSRATIKNKSFDPWEYDIEEEAFECTTPEDNILVLNRIPQTISFSLDKAAEEISISGYMSQPSTPAGCVPASHQFQPTPQPQATIISQYLCKAYVPFSRRMTRIEQQRIIPTTIKAERVTPEIHENKYASRTIFDPPAVSPSVSEADCIHFNNINRKIEEYLNVQSARNYSYGLNSSNVIHMNEIDSMTSSSSDPQSKGLHDCGVKSSIDAGADASNEFPSKQPRPQRKRKDFLEGISMGFFSGQKVDLDAMASSPASKHIAKKPRKPKKDLLANVNMGFFSELVSFEP